MLLVSDCCGAPMEEGSIFCPICGNGCIPIDEDTMEDIDEEPEEDNWKGELIEDRGIDADNFLFH